MCLGQLYDIILLVQQFIWNPILIRWLRKTNKRYVLCTTTSTLFLSYLNRYHWMRNIHLLHHYLAISILF